MDVEPVTQTVVVADGALTAYRADSANPGQGKTVWSKTFPEADCYTVSTDRSQRIWVLYYDSDGNTVIQSFDTDGNLLSSLNTNPSALSNGTQTPQLRVDGAGNFYFLDGHLPSQDGPSEIVALWKSLSTGDIQPLPFGQKYAINLVQDDVRGSVTAICLDGNGDAAVTALSTTTEGTLAFQARHGGSATAEPEFGFGTSPEGSGGGESAGCSNLDGSAGNLCFTCTPYLLGFNGVQKWAITTPDGEIFPLWSFNLAKVLGEFFSVLSIDLSGTSAYGFCASLDGLSTEVWKFASVNATGQGFSVPGGGGSPNPSSAGSQMVGSDPAAGGIAWINPSDALGLPDGNAATANVGAGLTESLDLYNFRIALPVTPEIQGIQVIVFGKANVTNDVTLFCDLIVNKASGGTYTRPTAAGSAGIKIASTVEGTWVFGGSGDLWNQTIPLSALTNNSASGGPVVSVYAQGSKGGDTVSIDSIQILVYGTVLPTGSFPVNVVATRVGNISLVPLPTQTGAPIPGPVMKTGRAIISA
jgi:hypothetical protein